MYAGDHSPEVQTASHRQPRSVTEVSQLIRGRIETDPRLSNVLVTGEVADHRSPPSGHQYFTLRDRESSLRCVMFRGGRGGRFLEDGAQVICEGRVGIYASRGDLQINVSSVEPVGTGLLQARLDELKRKLANEGLFNPSRKRPIPTFPTRIAVITSIQGAVLQDITNILKRRYPMLNMVVIPAAVQGAQAVEEIIHAFVNLDALAQITQVDAVILARGGGSLEDLMAFNDEMVARTIFACRTPVISAVGHETDHTIADLVADIRAPTPSAAAEIASPDIIDLKVAVAASAKSMQRSLEFQISSARERFELTCDRLADSAYDAEMYRNNVDNLLNRATSASQRFMEIRTEAIRRVEAQLQALGPQNTLKRGFTITRLKDGPVLTHASDLSIGDQIEVIFEDGRAEAETVSVDPHTRFGD